MRRWNKSCWLWSKFPTLSAIAPMIALAVFAAPARSQPIPFTEEAIARGVNYVLVGDVNPFGFGAAFADLDNDGDPDLITIGRADGLVGVYENDGTGSFIDRSANSGVPLILKASSVTAADYDGDGDLDLFFANWLSFNILMRNDGSLRFTDVTQQAGLLAGPLDGAGTGAAWGDYDNDGWLDLYLANRFLTVLPDGSSSTEDNRLFHNLGDGTFEEVAAPLGVQDPGSPTFQPIFFDFDRDGDADLYLSTDKGLGCIPYRNHLYENIGGSFVEITGASGTAACIDSMGVAVGDFDRNGLQDLYCTNVPSGGGNKLFLNQGAGVFSQSAQEAGVVNSWTSWGALFFDYNNDGYQDLYICNQGNLPNRLHENTGAWPTVDVAAQLGVDAGGLSFGLAAADIDNDGDLDFVLTNTYEPVHLYINHEGETRRWAKFNVVGQGANLFGVGANVDVRTGTIRRLREVIAGSNYKSQNEMTLHFGLNAANLMDEVAVMWPGGATRTLTNLKTNRTWTLYPTQRLGDANGDGVVLLDDFVLFETCFGQPFEPGCEVMDFDGDADVDSADFSEFLNRYTGPMNDCNANSVLDLIDIINDPALDTDADGVIDTCQGAATADLNGDGAVNGADLAILLTQWGAPGSADLNADGTINGADLAILLTNWSP